MKSRTGTRKPAASTGFTAEEKAAMKDRAREMKAEERAGRTRADGEKAALAAIRQMRAGDRAMGQRIHDIITSSAPALTPRTWYGMPAYASADGKVICFFQAAGKFKTRYATLGFQHDANLDEGNMWPTAFALVRLTAAEEKTIAGLVKRALT